MESKNRYKKKYLPLFYDDLSSIMDYIQKELGNPEAAVSLLYAIENSINTRMKCPLSFETIKFDKIRSLPYRRIYVKNYVVYYVVYEDIVEFRRILFKRQNIDGLNW